MNHFRITYGHHAKGNVLGAHVIGTFDLVNLISLGHDNAVMLQYHCIRIDTGLKRQKNQKKNTKEIRIRKRKKKKQEKE